jgi:hypothetical protein
MGVVVRFSFVQDLRLNPRTDASIVVDAQFLGEYFANTTGIKITEVDTAATVFEAQASREFFMIWTFHLKAGSNPITLGLGDEMLEPPVPGAPRGNGGFHVQFPRKGSSFELRENTPYELTLSAIKTGLHVRQTRRFVLRRHLAQSHDPFARNTA